MMGASDAPAVVLIDQALIRAPLTGWGTPSGHQGGRCSDGFREERDRAENLAIGSHRDRLIASVGGQAVVGKMADQTSDQKLQSRDD
jgi:hypothetical protein